MTTFQIYDLLNRPRPLWLVKIDLSGADLTNSNLFDANLTGVNLRKADLSRSDLTAANLTQADLSNANLLGADLTDATLERITLTGAIMLDGTRYTRRRLNQALGRSAQKVVPLPSWLLTPISPPWLSTIDLAMANPSPLPRAIPGRDWEVSAR